MEQFDLNMLTTTKQFPQAAYLVFSDGGGQKRAYGPSIEIRTLRAARLPGEWTIDRGSKPFSIDLGLAKTLLGLDNVWTLEERREAETSMDNHFRSYIHSTLMIPNENYSDYIFEIHTPFCD